MPNLNKTWFLFFMLYNLISIESTQKDGAVIQDGTPSWSTDWAFSMPVEMTLELLHALLLQDTHILSRLR